MGEELKTETQTRFKVIDRSVTQSPPVLSPSSIPPPPSSHYAFVSIRKNIRRDFQKPYFFIVLLF